MALLLCIFLADHRLKEPQTEDDHEWTNKGEMKVCLLQGAGPVGRGGGGGAQTWSCKWKLCNRELEGLHYRFYILSFWKQHFYKLKV